MKKPSIVNSTIEIDTHNSSSLVAKAGQIMAIIIAPVFVAMISSMLVSESLSGYAGQINKAGALRMQAIRISRASIIANKSSEILSKQYDELKKIDVDKEIAEFETRLKHLFDGGITNALKDPEIHFQFKVVMDFWNSSIRVQQSPSIKQFDRFVLEIDKLVTILQLGSEAKLSFLRLIQGISLFSVVIVAFVVLFRLNRTVIAPLKQLVNVAKHAGKGNFDLKASYDSNNELGILAQTFNQMSEELKSTYKDFENRVAHKTKELTRSNRSLEVLYHAASNLADNEYRQTDQQIIEELELALGFGKISIERSDKNNNLETIELVSTSVGAEQYCLNRIEFPMEKQNKLFGLLVWQMPKDKSPREWQSKMLQAMADIIATANDLELKRNTEDRLLIVEERAVIARELHDSLAQSLSYLKVQMSLLTRKMQKDVSKEQLTETIEDIKQGLNKAYQQLRELLTTFRLKLDDPSIEHALQGTVAEFSSKCNHPIDLDFAVSQNTFSANQEIHILQIVREALSNVHRHAKASSAGVTLVSKNDEYNLVIWDDGIGMAENFATQGHFGLGIMQERAKSLSAKINYQVRSPRGTRIVLNF